MVKCPLCEIEYQSIKKFSSHWVDVHAKKVSVRGHRAFHCACGLRFWWSDDPNRRIGQFSRHVKRIRHHLQDHFLAQILNVLGRMD